MADDHDTVLAESVFFIKKSSAMRRPHTKRSKEIGRDPKSLQPLRFAPAGKTDRPRAGAINPSSEFREDCVVSLHMQVSFKVGQIPVLASRIPVHQRYQLSRIVIWQRTQQHGVRHA